MRARARVAGTAVALVALAALVGTIVFVLVRDDTEAPPPSTTTTTTTTTVPVSDLVAEAVADALRRDLTVPIGDVEATCIAAALVEVLAPERLEQLLEQAEPLTGLTEPERSGLVRGVVQCVPPDVAAALLGSATTTTVPVFLPDEDL
jgi:hypothetical protein